MKKFGKIFLVVGLLTTSVSSVNAMEKMKMEMNFLNGQKEL